MWSLSVWNDWRPQDTKALFSSTSSVGQTSERTHFSSIIALPLASYFSAWTYCLVLLLSTWGSNAKSSVNQGKASFCPQDEVQKSFLKLSGFWTTLLLVVTPFFPLSISPTSLSSRSQVGCTSLQPQSFPLLFPGPEMSSPHLTTPRFPSNLNLVPLLQGDLSRHALFDSIHPCNMLL